MLVRAGDTVLGTAQADDGWPPPNKGWQSDCPRQHAVLRGAACHPQCPARDAVARDPEHAEHEAHREDQHGRGEQHRGEHCRHVDREPQRAIMLGCLWTVMVRSAGYERADQRW
jgi:hypothetical protein